MRTARVLQVRTKHVYTGSSKSADLALTGTNAVTSRLLFDLVGGAIVDRAARWSLSLMLAWSMACISIPLPSGGPELKRASLPVAGDDASDVREVFGEPQRLDVPSNWLYEWTTERKFVIVPIMPTGMPAGAAVAGNRYRMLVEIGRNGKVSRVTCTVREAPGEGSPALECELPTESIRSRARPLFSYRLDSRPGFEKTRFNQTEGTGAATAMVLSPDGRHLAATDAKNGVWIVNTESGDVVHHHHGEPITFFSVAPPGPVTAAFDRKGERLLIAQRKIGATILSRNPTGVFETVLELGDHDLHQAVFAGDTDMIVAFADLGIVTIQPDGERSSAAKPVARIDFTVHGPDRIQPAFASTGLIPVRLGQTWWNSGRTAVFAANGSGAALLDLRNDYARVGKQGYRFSNDGRWFAHNTGRHLEIWPSADILGVAEGTIAADAVAPSWVALMPFTHRKDDEVKGPMPITFRDDGGLVAAASQVAIHVWRTDGGQPVALIGAATERYPLVDGEDSIQNARADSWNVLRVLALALAPDNRLTAVLADSSFDITVAAWQIEE
jgi:hypothetical protein